MNPGPNQALPIPEPAAPPVSPQSTVELTCNVPYGQPGSCAKNNADPTNYIPEEFFNPQNFKGHCSAWSSCAGVEITLNYDICPPGLERRIERINGLKEP
eukprot:TRINITY_DN6500_c1_g1_i1.p1 TRINITY_DN6500_c1_g1~~TRINITY_DN6500_c1_g1_i1.p1  ORF type:complete len:109 (-),score=13.98 TRINITY_DN6500_c1_g1_i1:13-312(-)